ncbi:MAG: HNH endonuclease signature motif containing protein [bacterium]
MYSDEDEMESEDWDPSNPVEDFTEFLGAIMNPSGAANAMLEELVTDYVVRMDDDLDWAMDWSRRDDDYSRRENKWVDASLARGAGNHFQIDKMRKYFDGGEVQDGPAMAMRGGGGGGSAIGRLGGITRGLAPHVSRMSYNLLRKSFPNARKQFWRDAQKAGTHFKEFDWTPANVARVRNGLSPLDKNGTAVVLHHIKPLRLGGTNLTSNLRPVRAPAHRRYHRRYGRRRRRSVNGHREHRRLCTGSSRS